MGASRVMSPLGSVPSGNRPAGCVYVIGRALGGRRRRRGVRHGSNDASPAGANSHSTVAGPPLRVLSPALMQVDYLRQVTSHTARHVDTQGGARGPRAKRGLTKGDFSCYSSRGGGNKAMLSALSADRGRIPPFLALRAQKWPLSVRRSALSELETPSELSY